MIDAEKMVGATAYRFDSPYMKFFHDNFPTQMMECMYRNSAMCSIQEVGGNTCTVAVRILDALPDEWVYATLGLANFVHLVEAADGIPKQDRKIGEEIVFRIQKTEEQRESKTKEFPSWPMQMLIRFIGLKLKFPDMPFTIAPDASSNKQWVMAPRSISPDDAAAA